MGSAIVLSDKALATFYRLSIASCLRRQRFGCGFQWNQLAISQKRWKIGPRLLLVMVT